MVISEINAEVKSELDLNSEGNREVKSEVKWEVGLNSEGNHKVKYEINCKGRSEVKSEASFMSNWG